MVRHEVYGPGELSFYDGAPPLTDVAAQIWAWRFDVGPVLWKFVTASVKRHRKPPPTTSWPPAAGGTIRRFLLHLLNPDLLLEVWKPSTPLTREREARDGRRERIKNEKLTSPECVSPFPPASRWESSEFTTDLLGSLSTCACATAGAGPSPPSGGRLMDGGKVNPERAEMKHKGGRERRSREG